MFTQCKHFLFGKPLHTDVESQHRLNIPLALAVFASDALSSTAYATEEILIALVASISLAQANQLSIPVAIAIALLIGIVVISYRQVIATHPGGGGAYVVAKENLSRISSLIAASSLLIDYILTVSVSISAGVAAITSAGWLPHSQSVLAAVFLLFVITLMNLRGVKESAKLIAIPAYVFIFSLLFLIILGVTGNHHVVQTLSENAGPVNKAFDWVMILLLLKAFSHGCAALTGIEAISNGVGAFKEPSAVNANRTMVLMGCILASLFIGITYLAFRFHIGPSESETVISQVARAVFPDGSNLHLVYSIIQITTMIILVLAANTSFAGFPRLSSVLAFDGYLPRQLMNLGDRLVHSNGIILLCFASGILIIWSGADTHALIPLYAVGVFISFTLAQSGMVVHHLKHKQPGWQLGLAINGSGAFITGLVTLLLAIEKFTEGAWMVLIAIPIMIYVFLKIFYHYRSVGKQLALPHNGYCPVPVVHTVLVLVSSLNRGTIPALEYARTISDKVEAVHVMLNEQSTEGLKAAWQEWGCGVPLVVLESPYRSITEPLLRYIDEVEDRYEHDLVTIIVPEFVTKRFWHNFLHNQTALLLKTLLRFKKGKVVTTVRYYLEE